MTLNAAHSRKRDGKEEWPNTGLNRGLYLKPRNGTFNRQKTDLLPAAPSRPRKQPNCLIPVPSLSMKKGAAPLKHRKSMSLTELTAHQNTWSYKRCISNRDHGSRTEFTHVENNFTISEISFISSPKECELAKKVCKLLMLNAWRHCRGQVSELQKHSKTMKNKVEDLTMQVYVLQRLLKKEIVTGETTIKYLKNHLENEIESKNSIKKDLNKLQLDKKEWENTRDQLDLEVELLTDELSKSQERIKILEEECSCLKSELKIYIEKETDILAKLSQTTGLLRDKTSCLQDVNKKYTDAQEEIKRLQGANAVLNKEKEDREKILLDCVAQMKKKDVELNNLINNRKVQNETITDLSRDLETARKTIEEQEKTITLLETTNEEYKREKEEYDKNIVNMKNRMMFEAVKICAGLMFPKLV